MARFTLSTLVIIAMLVCCAPSLDARKLLNEKKGLIMESSLIQSTVMKGPAKRTTALSEKLFMLHLAHIDRILQSVPSPGDGH